MKKKLVRSASPGWREPSQEERARSEGWSKSADQLERELDAAAREERARMRRRGQVPVHEQSRTPPAPAQLEAELADALAYRAMGRRSYNLVHSRIGDSTDYALSQRAATEYAEQVLTDRDHRKEFVAGWVEERDRHLHERSELMRRHVKLAKEDW